MDDKRQHHRIICASKCLLYHARIKYSGVILNISLSGAGVKLYGMKTGVIKVGDPCNLILSANPEVSFCNYKVKITHISSLGMGLEFIEMKSDVF